MPETKKAAAAAPAKTAAPEPEPVPKAEPEPPQRSGGWVIKDGRWVLAEGLATHTSAGLIETKG